jgi:UDP-N-acetylglucosamine diphosphorylase / glucose-1-phosphate thymidylyltransferase / UDP-N-acetylgalactosamine diphosphorylase / glucosamine-1-phosphate N-acetyltransferase / galactosamine-1-phosphate N-acetyltransferase
MQVVLFEDALVDQLAPVTIGRPAFSVTCAAWRLDELLSNGFGPVQAVVRPHLRDVQAADAPDSFVGDAITGPALVVNARLAPTVANLRRLEALPKSPHRGLYLQNDRVVAALLGAGVRIPVHGGGLEHALLESALDRHAVSDFALFEYPHDILYEHQTHLSDGIDLRLSRGEYRQTTDGLFMGKDVQLGAHLAVDTRAGPVVIDAEAVVGPFCYLRGPVYIGPRSRVNEHAALKDGACLGHTTKTGGEVECSILEPYSNKQHHGFLGHSYVGSWVNMGAGTSNSDLKNTYGNVNMTYGGQKVVTGMNFVGCFLGDYAKTAVNSSIFTGKTIGAASMVYGFVTSNVPSFVNYARSFGQITEAPVDVVISMQARMFARRNVVQRPCDAELLRAMFERTRGERAELGELSSEPPAF